MIQVDEVLDAVSSTKRIRSLELIGTGKTPSDIAKTLGISGAGLNRYLESFKATKLVERSEAGYIMTPLGKKVLEEALGFEKNISTLVADSATAEKRTTYKELVKEIKNARMLSGRSLRELEKAVEKVTKETPSA